MKNACLQADSFNRNVFLHAPPNWGSSSRTRTWMLRVPTNGLHDAPATFFATLYKYLVGKDKRLKAAGLSLCVLSRDPCLYYVRDDAGHVAGPFATHIDDVLGCGERGITRGARRGSERPVLITSVWRLRNRKIIPKLLLKERFRRNCNYVSRRLKYGCSVNGFRPPVKFGVVNASGVKCVGSPRHIDRIFAPFSPS